MESISEITYYDYTPKTKVSGYQVVPNLFQMVINNLSDRLIKIIQHKNAVRSQ